MAQPPQKMQLLLFFLVRFLFYIYNYKYADFQSQNLNSKGYFIYASGNHFQKIPTEKIFLSKTKTLCAVILSYHLLTWFTGCPFRFFSASPAPGCGMTRALLAALRLDFAAAFSYHPLFFLLPFFPARILSRSLD